MGKILGEVFDKYVDEQIQTRQKSLAKRQKSPDDLVVFNSSTPWIRLSSSVLVGPDRAETLAKNLGIPKDQVAGNALAKNLVLFAGTSDGADLNDRKGGVGYGLKNSYGFLSSKEQGYKPMPGISSISAKYLKNGTLKQAQVNLTCFTREQFEAIEAIYLRLGFTMLLEWGHSIYFDNSGKKQNMSALKIPNILFREKLPDPNDEGQKAVKRALKKNPNLTNNQKDEIYFDTERKVRKDNKDYPTRLRAALQENKENTAGNYDAIVSKVQNFSWNLNSDLSYSITLDLISVGDIVDSLKMNFGGTSISAVDISQIQLDAGVQNLAAIELASGASAFNSFLSELTQGLQTDDAKSDLDKVSKEQLELKDQGTKILKELVPKIQEKYPPVLEKIKEKYITSYENIQDFLNGKSIPLRRTKYGLVPSPGDSFTKELTQKLRDNGFEELEKATSSQEFSLTGYDTERFFLQFDIDITPDPEDPLKGNLTKDTANDYTDSKLTEGIKELRKQLDKVKDQTERVQLKAEAQDLERNNLNLFNYLGEQSDRAKEVILDGLLLGFFDGEGKKFKSEIELSDYWIGDTIIRKWIVGTSR